MATPVRIGNRSFKTKKAATDACREIRDRYPGDGPERPPELNPGLGQRVDDPDDIAFIHDLVALHPEAEEKIGAGIKGFVVRVNENGFGGTRCFYVERVDGSSAEFSFPLCIDHAAAEQAS
ncbi:DCL family protein [Phytomonospora sp. NPDC050363]|uniref:DCL family protein n=1 Tax=Phytomonospora sp. NPDC050363 TaxID=3155642 RepID=UPI0033D003FA